MYWIWAKMQPQNVSEVVPTLCAFPSTWNPSQRAHTFIILLPSKLGDFLFHHSHSFLPDDQWPMIGVLDPSLFRASILEPVVGSFSFFCCVRRCDVFGFGYWQSDEFLFSRTPGNDAAVDKERIAWDRMPVGWDALLRLDLGQVPMRVQWW